MYIKRIYQFLIVILAIIALYALAKIIPILLPIFTLIINVLTPFIVAGLLSYFLYPLVKILGEKNIHNGLAITIIFTGFIVIFSTLGYFGVPIIIQQLQELSEQMPKLFNLYERAVYAMFENTSFLPEFFHDKMRMVMQQIEVGLERRIEHIIDRNINDIDDVLVFWIVPVLVFYILLDYKRIEKYIYKLLSSINFIPTDAVIRAIHTSLTRYIKGQLLITLFVALITFLIYHTLGLNYALLLAILMGIMNIIPYFGPIIGSIPAILIAFTTSWKLVIAVIISNIFVQMIESSFFSPYIMGKSVQMHPIGIIFVLIVGAELGGIVGMILAVPLTTILKTIYLEVFIKKQQCN